MSSEDSYERVYTGSETNVQYLQELFDKAGINSRVRNDFDSGLRAGFGGGLPGQVQLFVIKSHYDEALNIAKTTFPKDYTDEQ
ncbi:putative signal transducing protein [Salegentibacter sp. HM20]